MPRTIDGQTILLVEDEALIAMSESKILGKHGFNVISAYNAEKAIDASRQHNIDPEATRQAVGRLENQEEVLSFINRYRCRDGTYRWIEWRAKPYGSSIYAVARDITGRIQYQEELRVSEERFQKTLNLIPDMISIHDPDMNILYSNRRRGSDARYYE